MLGYSINSAVENLPKSSDFLKQQYESRLARNAQYSIRAFAKSLDLSHVAVSQFLKGSQNITPDRARQLSDKLSLSVLERNIFVGLAEAERHESLQDKKTIFEKLRNQIAVYKRNRQPQNLPSHFRMEAIRILLLLQIGVTVKTKAEWASILNMNESDVVGLFDQLVKLGAVQQIEGFQFRVLKTESLLNAELSESHMAITYSIITNWIQSHLKLKPAQDRAIGSESFVLDQSLMPELRKLTYEYLDSVAALSKRSKNPDCVVHAMAAAIVMDRKGPAQ